MTREEFMSLKPGDRITRRSEIQHTYQVVNRLPDGALHVIYHSHSELKVKEDESGDWDITAIRQPR